MTMSWIALSTVFPILLLSSSAGLLNAVIGKCNRVVASLGSSLTELPTPPVSPVLNS
jgi:hypothetical protein